MREFKGKAIVRGIAIGKIFFYEKKEREVRRVKISDSYREMERYEAAKSTAIAQLNALYEKALVEVGEENAQIFEVHAMMIEDVDFNDSIENMIKSQEVNAEFAVATTGDNFAKMFSDMDDEYFKARAADIKDISERLLRVLSGETGDKSLSEQCILVAKDLAPSETVSLDKSLLLAFVTELGSSNSHTAILARTMNIPALIGIGVSPDWDGHMAIIDGYEGRLIIDPDEETLKEYKHLQEKEQEQKEILKEMRGKANETKSGRSIRLYANIGGVNDLASVLENDAGGIGLFRSEFLYLGRSDYPSEEEQFLAYKRAAETMAGKEVIIRTLDIGADKQADYFGLNREDNPAMGFRAIRICLKRPDIFKTQLRAILRASAFGNISVMYPMIISLDEVMRAKEMFSEVKDELEAAKIPHGEVKQGIMIETPAAALISDELAKHVDFFSIGTNDLTQYTLAIDRQNEMLDDFYDSHHPAVMRLIRMVVENAHRCGIWVGICGELGADTSLTKDFLDMGVDELSVSPAMLLRVRKTVREIE